MAAQLMLAVRDAVQPLRGASGLDAGTLAVGIARSWAQTERDVLVIDADAHGAGLADRIGAATRTTLAPARRGLASLIAAREPLSARGVMRHCWRLPTSGAGSVWLLAAPTHPKGAALSAAWLAGRSEELAALAAVMAVVVSMPGPPTDAYEAISRAATHQVTAAAAPGTAPPGGLRAVLSALWLRFGPDPVTVLVAADGQDGIARRSASAAVEAVLGRLGPIGPAALLGGRARRRDRAPLAGLDAVVGGLGDALEGPAGLPTREAGVDGAAADVVRRAVARTEARTKQAAGAGR